MEWENKIVVITGASTGIGQATLRLLHQKGCIVYNLDIASPEHKEGNFIACDMRDRKAIRDAVKSKVGAEQFASGLFDYLYSTALLQQRFENFTQTISHLPRKQTRVLTWPLLTVFGFIAEPEKHIFLKPKVTQKAAEKYRFDFDYISPPNWDTYESLLAFAAQIRSDTKNLRPRDNIDLQSFIWVIGSDEYPD